MTEKRVSKVFRIWDWPRGVRARGWGLLHDQIWFYDGVGPAGVVTYEDLKIAVPSSELVVRDEAGRYWMRSGTSWLRLYMDRRMLWLPFGLRIRIHTFHSGDDDSAPHDHMWNFVTFPLADYTETVEFDSRVDGDEFVLEEGDEITLDGEFTVRARSTVRRFRLHYRPAEYRHFVHEPAKPFTTIVFAREVRPARRWGFWPKPDEFVPFDEWTNYE